MPDDTDDTNTTVPATTSSAPKPTKWTEGNFTIISSDNHVFKVADYHLLSARWVTAVPQALTDGPSSVFRGMMSAGTGPLHIELTDPTMEDSGTLGFALDFIVHGRFAANSVEIENTISLGLFLKKYDCAAAKSNLIFRLRRVKFAPRLTLFIYGAALDDVDLCVTALKYPLPKWAKAPDDESEYGHADTYIDHGCQFNSHTWGLAWVAATPIRYKWALDRAWIQEGDSASLASAFRTCLADAKGESLFPLSLPFWS